jgi:hypothetical protein
MRLLAPEWLILAPLLALAAWYWPGLRLWMPWRAAAVILLLLTLTQPQLRRYDDGLELVVLVDQSQSARDSLGPRLDEWEALIERSKGRQDRLVFIDFGADAAGRIGRDGEIFSGDREGTDIPMAVRFALSQTSGERSSRLLILTDGFSTRPLGDLGERLRRQEIALDYRLALGATDRDFRVESITTPDRVRRGEPFLLELRLAGQPDGPVPYRLLRDEQVLKEGTATLENGRALLRFTDRVLDPGGHRYRAIVSGEGDALSGNNASESWIEVSAGERVLLVSSFTDDPVGAAMRGQGFDVEFVNDASSLHLGRLAGAKAVVLNNVPAHVLPAEFLKAIDFFVRAQGGGLMMLGGRHSFGSGGYFQSAIDDLLPISMELRLEHRKLAVAMAIVLDRSGSMSMSVPGTNLQKIDLANQGASRAVELLGPQDAITVFAVDSAPHLIVPLTQVGSDPERLTQTIRRIASMGGGIFVYTGLEAAWKELQKSDAGQRHVILFADAADAEEPGKYKELLAEMTSKGATVSVIGMGSDTDSDANFLKDVAKLGNGRIFFNSNPGDLPALFAQETVSVARSAFLEEPVEFKPTEGWLEIAARPLLWPARVDGYNLSYLRPEATSAAVSGDEYTAPLVAFWQRGAGRTATVSFPLAGPFSETVRGWRQYGDFVQTLTRWIMGDRLPPGIALRARVDGLELRLELLYDSSHEEAVTLAPPGIIYTEGAGGESKQAVWQRLMPGKYECAIPLRPNEKVRGAVQFGPYAFPFGPVVAGRNPEWDLDPARVRELQTVANVSGGAERLDLTTIWDAPRASSFLDIHLWLLSAALLCVLFDALWTRLQWSFSLALWPGVPRR